MKQIILNIIKDDSDNTNVIINSILSDGSKIIKVIPPKDSNDKSRKFINDLKDLIINSYGD